jgi:hypothetical protein
LQRRDVRRHQRAAPDQPGLPDRIRIEARLHQRFDLRAFALAALQRLLARRRDAALEREVAPEVAEPADAQLSFGG